MARRLYKLPKAVFQFRPSHLIVPHCYWHCLLPLQSTTEIANIPGFRDMADNAHFLVRHGKTFVQTSKGCFALQTITLDRSTLLLVVPTSTVDNWDSQFSRILGYNAHLLVRLGKTFLQTSKGCFPVQTITLDRTTLLLAVPNCCTVDNWDSQYSWISRCGRQHTLFSSTWQGVSTNFQRQFSSSDHHTWFCIFFVYESLCTRQRIQQKAIR